jgi:glycosyltransferase involved in cell wall biosynthesis
VTLELRKKSLVYLQPCLCVLLRDRLKKYPQENWDGRFLMKISFVLPPVNMGGGIKVAAIYANELSKKGHEVVLVSPIPASMPFRRKIKSFITGHGWPKTRQNTSHLDGLGLDHRVLNRHRPVTDDDVPDADVVIATWWETAEWVSRLSDSKGAKVYFIQGHEVHEYLAVERSRATYYLPLHKIVISKWLQNIMRTEYGDTDVDLVLNSVDHSQFFSKIRGRQLIPTLGFMYAHSKIKGVDITLQVINRLRINFPNLRVIAFGSVKPEINTDFDNRIEFYLSPAQDKIRDLYAQCDVWLTASRTEGFNLPAMEAMACRTPVVSTKTGWPEEAVVTGKNGVLVEVDDIDGLTQGAATILSLPDIAWREMSENAYNTVALSNWQESTSQFEKILERACRQNQHTANNRGLN